MFRMDSLSFGPVRLPNINGPAEADRPSRLGRRLLDYFLLLVGCLAFVAALNITTRGDVKIDQFEFWLLGLLPFIVIISISRISGTLTKTTYSWRLFDEGFFSSAWLLSLLEFVALRITWNSEWFEFPVYASLGHNYFISGIILSAVYSVLGYFTALAIRQIGAFGSIGSDSISGAVIGCVINSAMFFLLVNPAPH